MNLVTVAIDTAACPASDLCTTAAALRAALAEARADLARVLAPAGESEQPAPGQKPCRNCARLAERNRELTARLQSAGLPLRETPMREPCSPCRRRPAAGLPHRNQALEQARNGENPAVVA
jgi:hypothetical protein